MLSHTAGYLLGAAVTGMLVGIVGVALNGLLLKKEVRLSALSVITLTSVAIDNTALKKCIPRTRRQVPVRWQRFAPVMAAGMYGVDLGTGLTTRMTNACFYSVLGACVLCESVPMSMLLLCGFGTGRAIPLILFVLKGFDVEGSASAVATFHRAYPHIRLLGAVALMSIATSTLVILTNR